MTRAAILKRMRTDPGAVEVTQFLLDNGASSAFLRRLENDLADLPNQFRRRRGEETRNEFRRRLRELSRKTRRLARQWQHDPQVSVWTLLPDLTLVTNTRLRDKSGSLHPTVPEFLEALADSLDDEAKRDSYVPRFERVPKLKSYVTAWWMLRLAETGLYSRRPLKHAAALATAVLGCRITPDAAKKYCDRLARRT